MKYAFFAIFIALLYAGAGCKSKTDVPVIAFYNRKIDIGHITRNTNPITVNFKFKNAGSKPLHIINVASDCSCTIPSYTKQPVDGDDSGLIKVIFNPKTILVKGKVERQIVVHSNTHPKLHTLIIKMFVDR